MKTCIGITIKTRLREQGWLLLMVVSCRYLVRF